MKDPAPLHLQDLTALASFLKDAALSADNLNDALVCASLYARLHWDNISGFFGDEHFEQALYEKWRDIFAAPSTTEASKPEHWVFVLTQVYSGGGHSRLFRQLMNGLDPYDISASLIVTHRADAKVIKNLPDQLASTTILNGNLAKRLHLLYDRLQNADVVVLLNNPDDIGAALAARALSTNGTRVLFVNHADHVFSFGTGAAETVLEICATGWRTTAQRRFARTQSFMGIPLVPFGENQPANRCDTTGPILSIGGPGKYKPSSDLNFAEFLAKLLSRVSNDVVLIGPSPENDWWSDVTKKYQNRIHLMGIQSPETVKAEFKRASCYVDSFPMDGGTVFSEAIMNGLPAFGLNRQSALGISPADALRCGGIEDLVDQVAGYLEHGLRPEGLNTAQELIQRELSDRGVASRVYNAAQGIKTPLPEFLDVLGNRDADYNARNWLEAGRVYCPKRAWRKLSLRMKWRLLREVSDLGLNPTLTKEVRRRIVTG